MYFTITITLRTRDDSCSPENKQKFDKLHHSKSIRAVWMQTFRMKTLGSKRRDVVFPGAKIQ